MDQRILLRREDGSWASPEPVSYLQENELQNLLLAYPQLIPGIEAEAAACGELQLDPGPADVVVVAADASLTIVECKLARNPQIRREIIGQLVDYASALWRMPVTRFDELWTKRAGSSIISRFDGEGSFRGALERTLEAGRFRLVLAVDAINPPLQRMVEYLNLTTGLAVVAVEYSRLRHETVELLVPTVYGEELSAVKEAVRPAADDRPRNGWTVDSIRADLESRDPQSVSAFDALVGRASQVGLEFEGRPALDPHGGIAVNDAAVGRVGTVSVIFYPPASAKLELDFVRSAQISEPRAVDRVQALLRQIGQIPDFADALADMREKGIGRRRPNLFLRELSPGGVSALVDAISAFNSGLSD
jgi:hypothetical protein